MVPGSWRKPGPTPNRGGPLPFARRIDPRGVLAEFGVTLPEGKPPPVARRDPGPDRAPQARGAGAMSGDRGTVRLYHCMSARSFRPLWMLEELGLAYDLRMLPFPPRVLERSYLDLRQGVPPTPAPALRPR